MFPLLQEVKRGPSKAPLPQGGPRRASWGHSWRGWRPCPGLLARPHTVTGPHVTASLMSPICPRNKSPCLVPRAASGPGGDTPRRATPAWQGRGARGSTVQGGHGGRAVLCWTPRRGRAGGATGWDRADQGMAGHTACSQNQNQSKLRKNAPPKTKSGPSTQKAY